MAKFSVIDGLAQVPEFLEAIGRGGEKVAFTCYPTAHHLEWASGNGNGAKAVDVNEETL
jgi:hypothetical protein